VVSGVRSAPVAEHQIYLRLSADDLRDLAEVLESRQGTANPLVGKLRALAARENPVNEPLEATHEDVLTFQGMISSDDPEPIMSEPAFRHVASQIEKGVMGRPD
jgi:hypothetical protein